MQEEGSEIVHAQALIIGELIFLVVAETVIQITKKIPFAPSAAFLRELRVKSSPRKAKKARSHDHKEP
jgi:hypothetical protein